MISVGRDNSFGHPTATTLDALRNADVAIFRTDRDGDVTVESLDGKVVRIGIENPAGSD